jgi:hypothetical protein
MTEKDIFAERGRSLEEEYFRKKDRELLERMRQAAEADENRRELGARTGLEDPELLRDLEELGFTPATVALLPLVPAVQMAWAEGGVTPEERRILTQMARSRGIAEATAADLQLADWLDTRPDPEVFTRAMRLIRAILDTGEARLEMTADDLVKYSERIALTSGGIFGLGRMSSEERALLQSLASELKTRHK